MRKSKAYFFAFPMMILYTGLIIMSSGLPQNKEYGGPWDIPPKYKNLENPYNGDESLVMVGKMLYIKNCKSCHGTGGEGDGPKSSAMTVGMRSFASEEVQAQSDGYLYYQSFIGRGEMPDFEKQIPDDKDRWAVINYIRTMKQ